MERVRPKMMTVVAIMAGLLPILWGTGTGSEVMSRIAAAMVGGMVSSTVLTLAVIPAIYALVRHPGLCRRSTPRLSPETSTLAEPPSARASKRVAEGVGRPVHSGQGLNPECHVARR